MKIKKLFAVWFIILIATCAANAQSFPLEIEHKFGTTVIEEKPTRIASVDYGGHDNLLALGVQPVVMRYWWGDHPYGVWDWALPYFKSEPVLLKGELDFEAIAAEKPDVIIALYSGIDKDTYEKLSHIAPVVAVPKGTGDYSMAWEKRALLTGRALGLEAEAKSQIQAINDRLAKAAREHPEWNGKTLSMALLWDQGISVYTAADPRSKLFAQLGFNTTPKIDELASKDPEAFHVMVSKEDPNGLDADLLVWEVEFEERRNQILELDMYPFLKTTKEGREIFVDHELSGAFSHLSLLSLPYAIDFLIPAIEEAISTE